jgi:hypothetical protein
MCINRLRRSGSNAKLSNDCYAKSTYLRKRTKRVQHANLIKKKLFKRSIRTLFMSDIMEPRCDRFSGVDP